jgi:glycosyltransferase involved in cell wall biosynthesis
VVTATGGNPEVVVDGESGLIFPVSGAEKLAEYLLLLGQHVDWRMKLGQQAIHRVHDQFSIESMVQNYARLYAGLVRAAAPEDVAVGV